MLVVILLLATTAAADDGRLAAEQLASEAFRTHDDAKLLACGKAYLDLYNHDPARPDGDEVLYNAAVCFAEGKSVGPAILAWDLVLRSYPRSKLAIKALMQSGNAYLRIAEYDRAAARFEDYASKYAGEKDARDALENAITLRRALGDRDKRVADTRMFVTLYGARSPKDAADAMYALVSAYDTPADQVKALREYTKTYGSKAAHEQLAAAYGRLGDVLWRQSCPVRPVDGLCVKIVRDKVQRCGASAVHTEVVARAAGVHKEALAAYDQAIKIVQEAGVTDPAAVHAAAMARLARGDELLERMLDRTFPTGLDFGPAKKAASVKRFGDWMTDETRAGEAASRAYDEVLAMKDPEASIAAAARLGQVAEVFSASLVGAEIPAAIRTGALETKAYCDQLTEAAAPLRERALTSYGVCVAKSTELGVLDAWTGLCRAHAHALDPLTFPEDALQPELTLAIPIAVVVPATSRELAAPLAMFARNEKAGWSEPACRQTAEAFAAVKGSADASYMAGVALHRCGLVADATKAWQDAVKVNGRHGAAHVDLALAELDTVRAMPRTDPARRQLVSDADYQARNALALASEPLPYLVLAMITADDPRKLELARALVDQAMQLDDKDALVHVTRAVLAARAGDWTLAVHESSRALELAPQSEVAQRVGGLVAAHAGMFDLARTRLASLNQQPYEVVLARAVAARGLGDVKAAEALYGKAIQLDGSRAEAHYDLGLLYEAQGDRTRATAEYDRAAAITPSLRR